MSSFFLQKMTCRTALLRHLTLPTCKELKFFKCLKCDPPKMYNQRASLYEHLKTYHKIKGLTTIRGCTEEAMGCWRCGLKMPLCDLEDHLQEHEDNDPELEILGSDLDPPAYSKQERHTPKKSQEVLSDSDTQPSEEEEQAARQPPRKRRRVRAGPSPPPSTEEDSQQAIPAKHFTTKKPSKKDRRKQLPHFSTTPSPSSSPTPPLPSMEQEEDEAQRQEIEKIKRAILLHETTEEEAVSTRSTRSVTRAAAVEQKGKGKGAGKKTKK